MDLPLSIVEGEIGVITYQVQCLEILKIQREKESKINDIPKKLSLNEIVVPDSFLKTLPKHEKIESAINFYKMNGRFDKPIVVKKDIKSGKWVLCDSYARYVAAQRLNLDSIEITFE